MSPIEDANREFLEAQKKADAQLQEVVRIHRLVSLYPDLEKVYGRYKNAWYCSKTVNAQATHFSYGFSCSCCPDPSLQVFFYVKTPHGDVHSNPPRFWAGTQDSERFAYITIGWEDKAREAGIPEELIAKVTADFEEKNASYVEEQEDLF